MRTLLSRAALRALRALPGVALCAQIAFLMLSTVGTCAAQVPGRSSLQYDARVLRYDAEKDVLYHADSVLTTPPGKRPGGRLSYHSTRLRAFRYYGPVGQGGIYDALKEDQARRELDPLNYQYRFRHPSAR